MFDDISSNWWMLLVQYDEIEPLTLLERCSLSETKYLLERCIGLIISKVTIVCLISFNCQQFLSSLWL